MCRSKSVVRLVMFLALIAASLAQSLSSAKAQPVQVENGSIRLTLDLSDGLALADILDKQTGHAYLASPTALFEFTASRDEETKAAGTGEKGASQSQGGLSIKNNRVNPDGSLSIEASAKASPLDFNIEISAPAGEPAAIVRMKVKNTGQSVTYFRTTFPRLAGLVIPGSPDETWGAIPQEVGDVGPLKSMPYTSKGTFGMTLDPTVGLPHAINSMELATLYNNRNQGGIFFASLDTAASRDTNPIQFTLDAAEVVGYWYTPLNPQQTVDLPGLAIGVYAHGDWHAAVDYYVGKNRPNWRFPQIPGWFRDEAAIYARSGGGIGAIYLDLPGYGDLAKRIKSFENLPDLLAEAQGLGTNIVYVGDYWEKAATGGAPYANKGDYFPRSDLGGAQAFIDGIQKVHQQGGRIILYVEPFIIYQDAQIAQQNGTAWAGHDLLGAFDRWYPHNYKMVAPFKPWQDYLISVATRLVRDYGADGIFLDSYSYQLNWPVRVATENKLYSPQAYNLGVLTLTERLRAAVQAFNPEAVVMGETTAGPISQVWDGGLSADFAFGGITKIVASPVRYGIPEVNIFSNGKDLNGLHQIYAAGHNLALCCNQPGSFMYDYATHVRTLVQLRQQYKDALIYGRQAYQPKTDNADIVAYEYEGTADQILIIVNTSGQDYSGPIGLQKTEANTTWKNLLSGTLITAKDASLKVDVPTISPPDKVTTPNDPGGIQILLRQP